MSQEHPASRNHSAEKLLCQAINDKLTVTFKYDNSDRTFNPYIVYTADTGKTLVHGQLIADSKKRIFNPEPRKFEIGLIQRLQITEKSFAVDRRFVSSREEYRTGTICVVRFS